MDRVVLKTMSLPALEEWLAVFIDKPFRRRQVRSWLYAKRALAFADMTDLPQALRDELEQRAVLMTISPLETSGGGGDGSVKHLFRLSDGETVEAVYMPGDRHPTLCISSQVGCPLDCTFCATGLWGFRRNLTQAEILDQVIRLMASAPAGAPHPNLVFMGMGEPLLNYNALLGALRILGDGDGLGYGARRITISTAGIPERIRQLADENFRPGLAFSLNASDDERRTALMQRAAKHSIRENLAACEYYAERTGRRVTLEYVLFAGINDRDDDAARLRRLTRGRPFKMNIIPFNPGRDQVSLKQGPAQGELRRPTPAEVERFVGKLLPQVPAVTVRWSQGTEVDGGCGQLRGRKLEEDGVAPPDLSTD
ncbi:MAG: 23S rRNA (adenine(2503)-C(2))-methyltransferase RlmN [bacterium]|nr:23S rRNA (adenine(2503)-C(2))-methyltransferase RlmN [bacterium]